MSDVVVVLEDSNFLYTAESPDAIRLMLSNGVHTIVFRKVNGDIREMSCTLDRSIVPPAPKDKASARMARPLTPGLVSAWDVNANGWRSFYVDSIIEIKGADGYDGNGETAP